MPDKRDAEDGSWWPLPLFGGRQPFSSRLFSDALWSLLSSAGSVVGGIATIKIITSTVSVSQYGAATLALGIVGLVNFLTVNPLFTAHLRVYFDEMRAQRVRSYLARLKLLLTIAAAGSVVIYSCVAAGSWWHGQRLYFDLIVPIGLFICLQPVLTATVTLLEAHRRFQQMALANIIVKLGQIPLLFVLLSAELTGSKAIVYSQALAILPVLFILAAELRRIPNDDSSMALSDSSRRSVLAVSLRQIGWSLVVANLVGWLFTTSDRYLLEHFRTVGEVGVYVANYGLWSIPYIVLNAWIEVLTRSKLYAAASNGDTLRMMNIFKWRAAAALSAGAAGTVLLFFAGQPIALLLLGSKYWYGRNLMIVIACAHVFYVVGSGAVSLLIAKKRIDLLLWVNLVGAASNIVMNLFFLPRYGILGAAWSTLLAYLVWSGAMVACSSWGSPKWSIGELRELADHA